MGIISFFSRFTSMLTFPLVYLYHKAHITCGVQPYGLCIALGILAVLYALRTDPVISQRITYDQLMFFTSITMLTIVIGSRALFIYENWQELDSYAEIFALTEGGFSVQGGTLATCIVLPLMLHKHKIPVLLVLDRIFNIFLVYGIARLGCFFAGCCYGTPSHLPWSITYTNLESLAPCFIPLHPTQLYSSIMALSLFLFFKQVLHFVFKKPGQLFGLFLCALGFERFFIDFFRADFFCFLYTLSLHQIIALLISSTGFIMFLWATHHNPASKSSIKP